ncbi:TraR/DksA family transcriptional regulator [Roseimicrobium gellanilyticum]|nr:TraR/DksA C4-type zinc finger protein [Roseimicrobium gellanilyticum]
MAEAAEPIEVDTESANSATDEFDHDLALAMWESEDEMLQEVDAAIQRIREGRYGLCEETGKVIPSARLMAMPWTRYTLEAEEKLEGLGQKLGPQLRRLHPIAPPGEANAGTSDESDPPQKLGVPDLDQVAAPVDDSTP